VELAIDGTTRVIVMPGGMPGIHALLGDASRNLGVDGRDKPGHDGGAFTVEQY
jgi:hypothetical protein